MFSVLHQRFPHSRLLSISFISADAFSARIRAREEQREGKRKETEVHFGTDMKLCDAAAWTTCLSCFRHVTLILRPWCAESLENQEPCTIEFPCVRFCLVTCLLVPVSGHKVAHFRVAREVRASVYSKRVYFLRFSRVNECKNETS